jgi:hypothetical protein
MSIPIDRIFFQHAKAFFKLSLLLFVLSSCSTSQSYILNDLVTIPVYPLEHSPQRILVMNTFDVSAKSYRQPKEELFIRLIDSVMVQISTELQARGEIPSEVLYGRTKFEVNVATINAFMNKYQASHAIIITDFDVKFNQTEVEVTGEDKYGKDKVAHYDIVSIIHYILYDEQGIVKDFPVYQNRFHSTRNVISGLLAAGPNIVDNSEDALSISRENAIQYLNYFFPFRVRRTRMLFDEKEFSKVREAIAKEDYAVALVESIRYVHNPDKKLAAKANYNCAILMERMNNQEEAKKYLQESLGLFPLEQAMSIKQDYGIE